MKKLGCLLVGVITVGVLIVAGSRVLTRLKRDLKPERRDVLLTSAVYDAERFRMARPILDLSELRGVFVRRWNARTAPVGTGRMARDRHGRRFG